MDEKTDSQDSHEDKTIQGGKRNRGRPKKQVPSVAEDKHFHSESDKISTSDQQKVEKIHTPRKRKATPNIPTDPVWSLEEKQRFVTGLGKGDPFRKPDGAVNWYVLTKYVRTKSLQQVKEFARNFNALENGNVYEEFSTKAAVDVWRQLADNLTMPGDNIANMCIPQVLTVAALEPVPNNESCINQPNYSNIYNYLSSVTRGTEIPDLPAGDAVVVLELLEDLIKSLSKSQTLIQREFMHARYAELRNHLDQGDNETLGKQYCTSTNPFAIPFDILEFKGESFSIEPTAIN